MAVVVPIISEWDPKGLNKAGSDLRRAEGGWAKAGAGFRMAFLPAVGALAGLGAAGVKFAKMASEDAASAAKMAKTFKNVTGATDDQIAATEEWITTQGKLLGVADDELRPALATLVSATGDVTKAQELAGLAMDVAASSGTDTATAAKAIAKATDGSFGSLKKLVPGIDDAALASKDFGAVMESTSKIVGGQATDAANTAEGQQKRLTLSLAETGESIGGMLLPLLEKLLPILQGMATFVSDNATLFVILAGAIAAVAAIVVVVNAAMSVYATISALVEANQKRQAAGQWALNAAMLANPVVLVVAAIVALIAIIVIAYKKSDTFRKIVDTAFAAIKRAVSVAMAVVVAVLKTAFKIMATLFKFTPLGLLMTHFREFKALMKVVADFIVDAFQRVWDFVSGIFDKIAGLIDKVKGWVSWLPGVSSASAQSVATQGTSGLSASRAVAVGGTSSSTVNVFGAVDPEGTARQVQALLDRHGSRQGRTVNQARRRAW